MRFSAIALCVLMLGCGAAAVTVDGEATKPKKTAKVDPYVGEWRNKEDHSDYLYVKAEGTAYIVSNAKIKTIVGTMANGALHLSGLSSIDLLYVASSDELVGGGMTLTRMKYLEGTIADETNDVLVTNDKGKIGLMPSQEGGWNGYPGARVKVAYSGKLMPVNSDMGFNSGWEKHRVKYFVSVEEENDIVVLERPASSPK